jgi:hypothetical protein
MPFRLLLVDYGAQVVVFFSDFYLFILCISMKYLAVS